MSLRIEPWVYRCHVCGETNESHSNISPGSATIKSHALLRLALPRGWQYVDVQLCPSDGSPASRQLSFVCLRCVRLRELVKGRTGKEEPKDAKCST